MIVARFRKCKDLVREGKVFVKNKAQVPSGVGYVIEESCILESRYMSATFASNY